MTLDNEAVATSGDYGNPVITTGGKRNYFFLFLLWTLKALVSSPNQ
jgi:hypothetical protein